MLIAVLTHPIQKQTRALDTRLFGFQSISIDVSIDVSIARSRSNQLPPRCCLRPVHRRGCLAH
jgi:hypothetical protein